MDQPGHGSEDLTVHEPRRVAPAPAGRSVADTLDLLARYGWTTLHDVAWPGGTAGTDHVAIGPAGVVVVAAEQWSGEVEVEDGVLRQNGRQRAREVERVAAATAELAAMLPPRYRTATRGVLCLPGYAGEPTEVAGVDVVGTDRLADLLLSVPTRMSVFEVVEVTGLLSRGLGVQPTPVGPARVPSPRTPGLSRGRNLAVRLTLLGVGVLIWVALALAVSEVFGR